jgi:hypothetical protein
MRLAVKCAPHFPFRGPERLIIGRLGCRGGGADPHGNDIDALAALVESHFAIDQREKRPIPARSDIAARDKLGAALADEDAACAHEFATESLHAEALADTVASISNASLTFLMSHKLILFLLAKQLGNPCGHHPA